MEEIAVIAGIAGTIIGAAVGYGAFRARLVALEKAYVGFQKNVKYGLEGVQERCRQLEIKMSDMRGELRGRGAFDPRGTGAHPKQ